MLAEDGVALLGRSMTRLGGRGRRTFLARFFRVSSKARQLNALYLQEMETGALPVLRRIRDLWWPEFIKAVKRDGAAQTLDQLDVIMNSGRRALFGLAAAHGTSSGVDAESRRQRTSQFLKSNTGKMFERFAGLALAYCLQEVDSPYAVMGFRTDNLKYCHGLSRNDFRVAFKFGDGTLSTPIDADIFAFDPVSPEADIYMISVKSTLKDRFHNVPFWNLLRRAAISGDFPEVQAENVDLLSRVKYVAICSDLAEQQRDFGTEAGARNLLRIDASLLDGAYVTASKALGLPNDCDNHLGDIRKHAFYRYSCFFGHLAEPDVAS